MTPSRRTVVQFAGVAAGAATVGWLTGDARAAIDDENDADEDDLPAYSRWLALEDGALEYTYVDWATLDEFVADELEEAQQEDEGEVPAEFEADPMVAPVSEGLFSLYLFVGLDLAAFRLGRILDGDAFESTVEELLQTDRGLVAAGAIEPDEIDDQLTGEPELDFMVQMEQTDEIGEYDVYTPVGDEEAAIAVGDDGLVVVADDDPDELVTVLETIVGTAEGDVERATDDSESVEWLLETAGRGDVAVGQYGGPFDTEDLVHPAFEPLEDAEGFVSSLTVEDEETSSGSFASIVDEPNEDELAEFLGASADEREIDVDDDRVIATATWYDVD